MNLKMSLQIGLALAPAVGVILLGNSPAMAQGPGGGGMPPEFAAKIKLWKKYSEEHKKATILSQTLHKIEGMNKDDDYKLDKKQSVKMLAIMKSWSTKPTMSEDDASTVTKEIGSFLTPKQTKKMATMPSGFGRPGGGGAGGGARPAGGPGGRGAGPGGPGGAQMSIPTPPKTGINPFNPNSLSGIFKDMATKSLNDFKGELEKTAH